MSSLLGICGIVYGLYFVFTFPRSGFSGYFDLPSLVLLGLLPPSIMLLSHKLGDFFTGVATLLRAIFGNVDRQHRTVINSLTLCSAQVRSSGIGALVKEQNKLKYDLLSDSVSLIVNNFSTEEIRHNILAKITARQNRMTLAANLFENMSKICPGVGMIGTLMGLITMMSEISDPSTIGSGMALALITTLYGLMLGTILYAPLGEKISIEAEKVHELDMLVLEGCLALKGKKSSIHMRDIMKTYGKSTKASPASGNKRKLGS